MTTAHLIQIAILLLIDVGAILYFGAELSRAIHHALQRYGRTQRRLRMRPKALIPAPIPRSRCRRA